MKYISFHHKARVWNLWSARDANLPVRKRARAAVAIVVPGSETGRSVAGMGRCNGPVQSPLGASSFSSVCYNSKQGGVKLVLIRYFSLFTRTKSTSRSPLPPSCPPPSSSPIAPFPPHRLQRKTMSE